MIIFFQILAILLFVGTALCLATAVIRLKEAKKIQLKLAEDIEELKAKYRPIEDLEEFKGNLSNEINVLSQTLGKYREIGELDAQKTSLTKEIANLQRETVEARNLNTTLSVQADAIRQRLELYNGEQTVINCGLYTPVYDFDISQKYKDALTEIREEEKTALKEETAAICTQIWSINGNASEGKKLSKHYIRLMLRAFNGESDAIISSVRWNNVDRMIERLEDIYQAINKLGETYSTKIQRNYFQLKLKELRLTYEYQEKVKAEKDEQRRIQEQIREEVRAQKELEKQLQDAEDEENRSRLALERARHELQLAHGEEAAKMSSKIETLEAKLAEALANKERAKSQAQMTKAGNVYIISNIGSFGENRFKIGMTRRKDPYERVDELGDASVPFEFDVHAMIPSDNAPQLEWSLHERFRNRSVNLVNQRKEFFDVSLDEIAAVVREFNSSIEILKIPEARSYRQTLELRKQQPKEAVLQSVSQLNGQQVYVLNNGSQEGPFSFEAIKNKITSGQINPATTLLWYDGLADWTPTNQIVGEPASAS